MHIINKTFLKLALLPGGAYKRLGVNGTHLKAILTAKLTIDDRRPNTLQQTRSRKPDKPVTAATAGTVLVSLFMGLIFLISFYIGQNTVTHLTFYFSFFFFMLAASLIPDFTSVLIDVRDNYIILPKPVSDRTIVTARILHIFIHICKLVVPMCLPGAIYMAVKYGGAGCFYLLVLVFMLTLFVIFFINALYIIILRITTPARFQSIISYVQIVFAIAIYASYQILPRLTNSLDALAFDAAAHPVLFALPMYWAASGWNSLYTLQAAPLDLALLFLCFAVPVSSLAIVIKYLAPSFNNKLALINNVNTEATTPVSMPQRKPVKQTYAATVSKWVTAIGAERMGFLFAWKMTGRSRDFKVKVYPAIGYLIVIVVMLFLRNGSRISLANLNLQTAKTLVISGLYFTSILLLTAVNQISQSERAKASWIYFITPLAKPGDVISGALKAALFKFYIPVVVLLVPVALYFIGPSVLPNLVLGFLNQVLITSLVVYGNSRVFPFSLQQNNNAKGGALLKNMMLLLLSAVIGFGHYLVYGSTGIVIVFIVLSAIATWLLLTGIRNTSWQKINAAYAKA